MLEKLFKSVSPLNDVKISLFGLIGNNDGLNLWRNNDEEIQM